ncbi:hypothetical protein SAMN05421741_10721 [Paenimyroides ummariense]|uniref:Outer membrane protein beta-barrel domain-containing protein n=1 Tax=Paenimyroides ummariense TaxID=913024 RepID=A0A1I4ZY13_9FLAO|nr:hypothetical protein [Paenimyroides ummariense]SFN55071.1 hypothetical protein SAMN05421741_10721 [Paenimyroides ummariense]
MKKCLLAALLVANTTACFAQSTLENIGKVSLGLQGAEFSYELPLSKSLLLESAAGLGVGMEVDHNKSTYSFYLLDPVPFVSTELKWIYNREKREAKEKNNANNAGNYVGLQTKYSFGHPNSLALNKALLTDIHWGLQRSLGTKFTLNTNIGLGYMYDFDTTYGDVAPVLRLKFGYRLF